MRRAGTQKNDAEKGHRPVGCNLSDETFLEIVVVHDKLGPMGHVAALCRRGVMMPAW